MDARPSTKPRNTIPALELLRGLASLDVFLFHLILVANIPNGLFVRLVAWGPESVIIFFVLSGYVIGLSQHRKHRGTVEFIRARFKRIYPIYFFSLGLALAVSAVVHWEFDPWQFVGHLFFLQSYGGTIVPWLSFDTPLWTLGVEVRFYLLFALAYYFRRYYALYLWAGVSVVAGVMRQYGHIGSGAGAVMIETLSLSPCWLLGYFACGWGNRYSLSIPQVMTLAGLVPLVSRCDFSLVSTVNDDYDALQSFLTALLVVPLIHTLAVRHLYPEAKPLRQAWPWVVAVVIGVCVFAVLNLPPTRSFLLIYAVLPVVAVVVALIWQASGWSWPQRSPAVRKFCLILGGTSYAVYTIHFPLTRLVVTYTGSHLLQLIILVPLIGAMAFGLEYFFQPRATALLDWIWAKGKAQVRAGD